MTRFALPLVLVLSSLASAALPEPGPNEGATKVDVEGTRVTAEARAVAKGHTVDAIVVLGLAPATKKGAAPAVRTYDCWTLDGRTRKSRGDKALGARWRKLVAKILKEVEDPTVRRKADPRDLLGRLERALGESGSRVVGEEVVGWAMGLSECSGSGRRSIARTAVVTILPRSGDGTSTPRPRILPPRGTTTPGPDDGPRPVLRGGGRVTISGLGARSGGVADSRVGASQHSRMVVDLTQPPVPAPEGTPTPDRRGR